MIGMFVKILFMGMLVGSSTIGLYAAVSNVSLTGTALAAPNRCPPNC